MTPRKFAIVVACFLLLACLIMIVEAKKGGKKAKSGLPPIPSTRILLSMSPWLDFKKMSKWVPTASRKDVTSKTFHRDYVSKSAPVIVTGATKKWPDFGKVWTDASLMDKVGNVSFRIHSTSSAYVHLEKPGHKGKKMSMRAFLSDYEKGDRRRLYIDDVSVNKVLKPLLRFMRKPAFASMLDTAGQRLFMGKGGDITPPRCDRTETLVVGVTGGLEITLFPPTDTNYLYPMVPSKGPFFVSEVNAKHIFSKRAKAKHPLVRRAHPLVVTLKPGQILYIPSYWWRRVTSQKKFLYVTFRYRSNSQLADAAFDAAKRRVVAWRESLDKKAAAASKKPGTGQTSKGMRKGGGRKGSAKNKDEL